MTPQAQRRNTAGYFLLFVSLGFGLGITGPALPSLAEQTGSDLGAIGTIFLVSALGGMAGTVLGGRLYDRLPRGHRVLGLAQLLSAAMLAAMPLAGSLPLLLLIAFFAGLPVGLINTGGNTLMIWTRREKAGPYVNALHFAFGLGAFLAPTLFAQVVSFGGTYRLAYWILAGVAAPMGLLMLALDSDPPRPHREREKQQARADLRAALPIALVGMLFIFFYVGSEITYGNWLYTYALSLNLADAAGAAYLTSGFWLSFTIGRALSIPAAARLRPGQILSFSFSGGLAALALVMAAPESLTLLWGGTVLLGLSMAPVWATGYNLTGQSIRLTATLSSIIILGDSLGAAILPWLTGRVVARLGAETMPQLVFGSLAVNALIFGLMLLQRRRVAPANLADEHAA